MNSAAILYHWMTSAAILCHWMNSAAILYHWMTSAAILCHWMTSAAILYHCDWMTFADLIVARDSRGTTSVLGSRNLWSNNSDMK